jgi:hypothetical protein
MSSPIFLNAKKRAGVAALALAMGLIAGCASTPVPDDEISVSKHAVESAVSAGGSEFAPIELKTAQDKLTAAEKAVENDDNLKALHLAQAAEVDAKLAEHKALAAKAEKSLKESREGQRVLQEEIQRQQP